MKISTILYDLDGVLVNATEWHFEALNKALNDIYGYKIPKKDHYETFNGLPTRSKLSMLVKKNIVDPAHIEEIFRLKQYYTISLIGTYCKPDPVKVSMMHGLPNYRKGCVTNSIFQTAYEMLVRSGLNFYMEYVQGNEATPFPKPNPSPYLKAMSVMGVEPKETLIIEDCEKGFIAAVKSGARVYKVETYDEVNLNNILGAIEHNEKI